MDTAECRASDGVSMGGRWERQAERDAVGGCGEGATCVGSPPRVGSSVRGNSHTEDGGKSTTWSTSEN